MPFSKVLIELAAIQSWKILSREAACMALSENQQKRPKALAPRPCTAPIKTFCITIQLTFHRETHHPTSFLAACAFISLSKPCLSFPSFLIPHSSHLAFTFQIHSSVCRCALHISGCVHFGK